MDRDQYIAALNFCFKVETAGAIAGEVAMLLREDASEKQKLDLFRRLEASNKHLCAAALRREQQARPTVETSFYRNGYKLGQKLGDGDWDAFLDRFEATLHPTIFSDYLLDDKGDEIAHEYEGVDVELFRHLLDHESSLVEFVQAEQQDNALESTKRMETLLSNGRCAGLVSTADPVGYDQPAQSAASGRDSGRTIIALDGCPLHCVKQCLGQYDIQPTLHYTLPERGLQKRQHEDYLPADVVKVKEQIVADIDDLA